MSAEKTIFADALALAPDQRQAFVARACGDDADLRAEVEALLAAHDHATSFLESPPPGLEQTSAPIDMDLAGETIGHYKLLERIGEGGMGVVYMAEQLRPVKRRVALKITKPGLDTRQVIARFEAERQALAMMDHPSIAKVFDAGATDSGRSYFVMELVRGVPITEYCDQHHLSPRQRLELFVQVCQAVQHAHQKGIIHRDLKPNNVLVTLGDNDKPIPKVIDFGIAKATGEQRLTDRTLFTEFRQLIGTPLYMSPEQAEMSQLTDVDTRSDVYSLGVLLYELLTGTTPFDKQRLAKAAYDEVRRIIREEEPPRPSTRLSTLGQTISSISAQRQSDPKKLSHTIRGELDWIVMKALEKERTRRYETANGLARDVERYLAVEPVEACPPSRTYRFRKFVKRNRSALAVAGVVGAAFLIAAIAIGWTVRDRAAQAGQYAHERAARRARVSGQVESMLDEVARLEKAEKWSDALVSIERAEPALASGDVAPDVAQRARQACSDLLLVKRLDDIRSRSGTVWGPMDSNPLDHNVRSITLWAERDYAATLRDAGIDIDSLSAKEAAQRISARGAVSTALVPALHDWLGVRNVLNDSAASRRLMDVLSISDPDPWRQRVRDCLSHKDWRAVKSLAISPDIDHEPAASIAFFCGALRFQAEADYEDVSPGDHVGHDGFKLEAQILRRAQFRYPSDFWINHRLGMSYFVPAPEALSYLRAAVAIRPDSAHANMNLGSGYQRLRNYDEAILYYRKAIELDPAYRNAYANLGEALIDKGFYAEGIAALEHAINLNPELAASTCAYLSLTLSICPDAQLRDAHRAARLADQALQVLPNASNAWTARGVCRYRSGEWQGAVGDFRRSLQLAADGGGTPRWPESVDRFLLAMSYWQLGQSDEARQTYNLAVKKMVNDPELVWIRTETEELLNIAHATATSRQSASSSTSQH